MSGIPEDVLAIIRRHCSGDALQLSVTTPLDALAIDSLAMVEILFELEETFDVAVPDSGGIAERFANFRTPADIVAAVEALLAAKQSACDPESP